MENVMITIFIIPQAHGHVMVSAKTFLTLAKKNAHPISFLRIVITNVKK